MNVIYFCSKRIKALIHERERIAPLPANVDQVALLKRILDEVVGLGPLEDLLADSNDLRGVVYAWLDYHVPRNYLRASYRKSSYSIFPFFELRDGNHAVQEPGTLVAFDNERVGGWGGRIGAGGRNLAEHHALRDAAVGEGRD